MFPNSTVIVSIKEDEDLMDNLLDDVDVEVEDGENMLTDNMIDDDNEETKTK